MKKDTSVLIKLSEDEKESFKQAADFEGLGFSAWARQVLRKEASKIFAQHGKKPTFLNKSQ